MKPEPIGLVDELTRLRMTVDHMRDTLERIAIEYPAAVEMCQCPDKPGYACPKCEIAFLLQEWGPEGESTASSETKRIRREDARITSKAKRKAVRRFESVAMMEQHYQTLRQDKKD